MNDPTKRHLFGLAAALAATPLLAHAERGSTAPARRATGTIVLKDRTELFVKDWGRGRPVVLTHAWPLSSDCWDQIAIALVDAGYRVIAYDRRGFGRSSQPDGGYTYDQFADDLAQVLQATGARDATLVGFSMGGGEVVRYLSRHAGRHVRQVGLVATVVPGLAKGPNNPARSHGNPAIQVDRVRRRHTRPSGDRARARDARLVGVSAGVMPERGPRGRKAARLAFSRSRPERSTPWPWAPSPPRAP